ncbi:hypothetical protein IFM89_016449 [Coptis chinensis]|uniref:Armadillo-like repeats domain-containing protein n=1 Tax=Coptis chinensis TaxID=261450 RepID=A0A835GZM4_9MAGN|nr:hypothetical protein IFM89_016449 [Coptis chinensis]
MAYAGLTFVIAFVKTFRKFNSPKAKRHKLQIGFGMEEVLRKYIRYAMNEKPFNPDMERSLIIKEILGVTDEDVVTLRTNTHSETGDVDSIQKMVGISDSEQSEDESFVASQE